jgi:O-antigen/teichoic acid export membrane protein
VRVAPNELAAMFEDVDLSVEQQTAIQAGQYVVRLVYSPRSFQVGFFGSVISAALAMFIFGVWIWRLLIGDSDENSATVSRVARNSVAPIILNLFNRGIDFAFAFVMLRILGPEDAGIYYYAIVVFVWFDIFTNFGLDVYLIREVSRKRDQSGYFFLNTSALRVFLMLACIPLLLGFLLVRQATVDPALTNKALLAIGLLYIGLAPGSLNKGLTSLFYAYEKAEYPAAVSAITTMNKATLGLIVLLLGYGIVGLAAVSIVVNFVTLAILLWAGRGLIGKLAARRPDRSLMRGMVNESYPLMLNHFLATIFFQIDIVILEALKGARLVGKYSVAYRWLLALNIIPAFFTQALLPVMSRQANEDRERLRQTYTLAIKMLVAVAIPLAVIFTFLADDLTLLLGGSEFMPEGALALQIMIWSIPIGWINSLTQYALIAVDLQRQITRAFIIAVAFNIITNLIFIPQYGYRAAAVTTIFSEAVLLIPFGVLLQSALGRLAWIDMIWRPALAGSAMFAVLGLGWTAQPILALIAAGALYPVVLFALKPLSASEWAMLAPVLPARVKRLLPAQ